MKLDAGKLRLRLIQAEQWDAEMDRQGIRITWYGHSYFLIELGGVRIAIDPHDGGSLNLPEFRVKADLLLVTHNHYDHNAIDMVEAEKIVKWSRNKIKYKNIEIIGYPSYHDKAKGLLRGENTVYLIRYDNLRIVHFGDIGHLPDEELIRSLKGSEIVFVPVGGVYTINADEAWELLNIIKPKLFIPMHYWIPYSTLPLDPLEKFLNKAKARRLRLDKPILTISPEELPEKPTIVVMPPPTLR